jgi:hypothetical protein
MANRRKERNKWSGGRVAFQMHCDARRILPVLEDVFTCGGPLLIVSELHKSHEM